MHYMDHISISHKHMLGKPCIKGTRIPVEHILKRLSEGMEIEALLQAYPSLKREDIFSAIAYGADMIRMEEPLAS